MTVIPDSYFDRFATPKYRNRNPLQRFLIRRFVHCVRGLVAEAAPRTRVVEIGCGEGFLIGQLSAASPELAFTGVDPCADDLERLREKFPGVTTHQGSIYDLAFLAEAPDLPDLIVCCEVLEHLAEPGRGLEQMIRLAEAGSARLLLSVPHEPWFQLSNLVRGKNLGSLGNDSGHVNRWGRRGFEALLARRCEILAATTSYPWQLALVSPR